MGILFLVFFLSGACALAYQIVWIRLFGLVFGGTVVSMSVVIGAFMGGLALGSKYFGKYAERIGNRVRLYGFLEVLLGVAGLLVFFAIKFLSKLLYSFPFDIHADSVTGVFIRLFLSFAILIVPTLIMGGTLPVLLRAITDKKKDIIVNTSLLYAFNTLGAMTGTVLVGFVLIRFIGVWRTNLLTVFINLAMGVTALAISGRFESEPDIAISEKQPETAKHSGKGFRFVAALGITGFVGLTLEMVWMRTMLLVSNNTTYLYSIVITVVLFGLGLGGLLLPVIVPQKRRNERTFGFILLAISFTTVFGYAMFPLTTFLGFSSLALFITFLRLSILTMALTLLLGFLPVFLMGLSLPIGVGLFAHEIRGLSGRVGLIYAVNTLGALIGSLATVFVLIPLMGITMTILLCVVMTAVPGFYFIMRTRGKKSAFPVLAGGITVLFIGSLIVVNLDIPRSILKRRLDGDYIEYLNEGRSSTIWITNKVPGFRKIWIDNLWVSSTSREGTHALLAHYPMLFHENPKTVVGIAFGTGQTFGTCLLYPIESIKSVEIDPEIITACKGRFTTENYGILEDPRNEVIIDDGRFFLAGTSDKFDIITAEPLQPYTRGTVNLYSYEFYEACKRALQPGGVVAQWLPVYNSGVADSWSLIRSFTEAFDHVLFFLNAGDGILLGSDKEMRINPSKPVPERVLNDLKRIENGSIYDLTGNYICSREKLLEASKQYPVITDDRPTLEFTAPISHWNEELTGPVMMRNQFIQLMEPMDNLFTGTVDWETARRFRESRRLINLGFVAEKTGNFNEAHRLYVQAYTTNKHDIRAIKALFMFLRKQNRLQDLPPDLQMLRKPPKQRQ